MSTATASRWSLGIGIFEGLLAVTVFGLVLALFIKTRNDTANCGTALDVTVNATCDMVRVVNSSCIQAATPCLVPYYVPALDKCAPESALGNTTCNNICYDDNTTTVCDNTGNCTGDPAKCKGHCQTSTDCNNSLPINPAWVGVNDSVANVPVYWWSECLCWANKAEQFALMLFWQQDNMPSGEAVGAGIRCRDLLDVTFAEQYDGCLTISRYLLDPLVTPPQYYLNPPNGTPCASQFALCVFSYTCAILNDSFFPPPIGKRYFTQEQQQQRSVIVEEDKPSMFLHPVTRQRVTSVSGGAEGATHRLLKKAEADFVHSRKRAPPACETGGK